VPDPPEGAANATALATWRDGPARDAILSFVRSVTEPGPGFVPESDRIAAFDNDGTLWCERPLYIQADFVLRRWRAMLETDPSRAQRQPYAAVANDDREWLSTLTEHIPELVRGVSEAFGGLTTEEFEAEAVRFFREARHPIHGVPYTQVAYTPMLELIRLLEANRFRVFICSAGGRDFVRAVCEEVYGIPRERVIGSSAPVELRHGALVRTAGVEQPIDDGPGKPVHLWARTGRRPLFAGGNADGDIEMLSQARFALLVRHDDPDREEAYDTGSERALGEAAARGWTVASMRNDFATVFEG
jgi:phosphoglycolate phosphatase-like HAD superfamily hydrolase